MRAAFYVRVSTERQQQAQTIEQQVAQLRSYTAAHPEWEVREEHIFRDDGHSGARLDRPGLDALRDQAARGSFDLVLITAPDRLARHFVHQMVVLEGKTSVALRRLARRRDASRSARAATGPGQPQGAASARASAS